MTHAKNTFAAGPELLTSAEMRAADRFAVAQGTPSEALMTRAGEAVAEVAATMVSAPARIIFLCGPGDNGGDGFVAARRLREQGLSVALGLLGGREHLKGDAAAAAQAWGDPIVAAEAIDLDGAGLIVDALFGAGLNRDLDGAALALVRGVNAQARQGVAVLAVDVPSGLDADSGAPRGAAIEARATVTFFRRKPGHLLLPGRLLCGDAHLRDIGVPREALDLIRPRTSANTADLWRAHFPAPHLDGHKYARGHAVVLSGGAAKTGAARLSARAALRVGAGLVTVFSPRAAQAENAAHLTAIMLSACDGVDELSSLLDADERLNALVMGPGLGVGEATAALVRAALRSKDQRAIVLDADALTSFTGEAASLGALIKDSGKPVVLTPHGGEFARLFGAREGSKLVRARQAAHEAGAIVLLKGADTVVAHPDGRASIASNAPPWLATAGAGDVLAGMIAGLLAQAMPPFEATSAAVWLHGDAARSFGLGLIAEDLPDALPRALKSLVQSANAS